jgi:hypothetical protein
MALAGIETLHPDVFIIEERGIPRIVGVGVNTGGFVGAAQKGPIDRADLVTNLTQFNEKYGPFFQGSFLEPAVRAFFNEGGTRCFIARVLGLGATEADTAVANSEGSPAIDVNAISPGAWGNDLTLQTERWRTTVAASPPFVVIPPVGNGSYQIPVTSLRNIKVGDLIVVSDSVSLNSFKAFIYSINVGLRVLVIRPLSGLPPTFEFPVGSLIQSATDHRLNTLLDEDLVNGATSVLLKSTSNVSIGARLYFDDGQNYATVLVERLDGKRVRFAAVSTTAAATLPKDTTIAVSQEFNLKVYEAGKFRESFNGLSMEFSNTRDYFVTRLSGDSNESKLIEAIDLFPPLVDPLFATPAPSTSLEFLGGTEGAPLNDADYIGDEENPKSGMFLLDAQPELNFFSIPGITSVVVQKEMVGFADRKANIIAILDAPLADDEPLEVLNYRNIELNVDSSYAALYYPWLIERDPLQGDQRISTPPCGHVQGKYAETGITRGVQFAPANVTLRNVIDLTYNVSDGEHDLLNPAGVNVIRSFSGEGIRIFGARTLTSFYDGRHYVNVRRLMNFVKESLRRGLRFAIFELNEPRTWTTVTLAVEEFLRSMFLRGQLFSPDGDPARAFFVKCDAETNPTSEIREGRMNVEVGINPPFPAEFVVVRLGIFDGGSTIEEELARR